jgi:hypothetical protein
LVVAPVVTTGIATAANPALVPTDVYYVKPTPVSLEDCSDWDNACDLQTALDAPVVYEVWVMQGVYTPGLPGEALTVTFQLKSGVALYGGFLGTEGTRDERDWRMHETVLSGDIDDDGTISNNSYHVVTGSDTDQTAILDGYPRCVDIPSMPNTGVGIAPIVDMGAYEVQIMIYLPLVVNN